MKSVHPLTGHAESGMDRPDEQVSDEPRVSASFLRSLPLFIVSGIFFALGAAVLRLDPTYGPGTFTLWALLLALGFVAAIGGVASWLLVEEPTPEAAKGPRPRAEKGASRPVAFAREAPAGPSTIDRLEFGRPAPSVHDLGAEPRYPPSASTTSTPRGRPAEWDEDAVSDSGGSASDQFSESISPADALKDLDGIEQELVPRTSLRGSAPTTA
jgi:hypothetical protein